MRPSASAPDMSRWKRSIIIFFYAIGHKRAREHRLMPVFRTPPRPSSPTKLESARSTPRAFALSRFAQRRSSNRSGSPAFRHRLTPAAPMALCSLGLQLSNSSNEAPALVARGNALTSKQGEIQRESGNMSSEKPRHRRTEIEPCAKNSQCSRPRPRRHAHRERRRREPVPGVQLSGGASEGIGTVLPSPTAPLVRGRAGGLECGRGTLGVIRMAPSCPTSREKP